MKSIFTYIFCISFLGVAAQNKLDNQLLLGDRGGVVLDFKEDEPILTRYEVDLRLSGANSSICDKDGKLLLYTNGCKIYNNDFKIMTNGDSISHHFLREGYCDSSNRSPLQQGALILPMPSSDSLYMVLYNDLEDILPPSMYLRITPGTIYASIVDMSLEDGKGAVIEKNTIVLKDSLARNGLMAHKHLNDNDWWIIYPEAHTNCMYVMLLTEDGISNIDKQCIGHVWSDKDLPAQSTFSPDGKKYCRFNYDNGLNLYDFDTATGNLSNHQNIDFKDLPTNSGFNGAQFSPNSRFIYVTTYTRVFQLDINSKDISYSRTLLGEFNHPDSIMFNTFFHSVFLAPNGKIYIGGTNQWNHLHTIHNPNCKGLNSDFEPYALRLNTFPNFSTSGVPNFPHFRIQNDKTDCDTTFTSSVVFLSNSDLHLNVYPNPSDGVISIDIQSPTEQASVSFLDLAGRIVLKADLDTGANTLYLNNMGSGIYFYKIYESKRFVGSGKLILKLE